jgi:hypothetical protein
VYYLAVLTALVCLIHLAPMPASGH